MSRYAVVSLVVAGIGLSNLIFAASAQRIQSIPYNSSQVVPLLAAEGYAVVVELSEEERVENVIVGDSRSWQVTTNKRGNRIIVKPVAGASLTDLIVTTDRRDYVFVLQGGGNPASIPFLIRFTYPNSATVAPAATRINAEYKLRGAKALFPVLMTDDGKRTTIRWSDDAPLPAIAAVNEQRREAIVNGRMIDGEYIIEGVAERYVFRRDKAQAVATRRLVKDSTK